MTTQAQTAMRRWLNNAQPAEARTVARRAGTSVAHMRHIAAGRRAPSADLAQRLARATGGALDQRILCDACHRCPLAK